MSEHIREKIEWCAQNVYDYGGDGEYAGSFDEPDFVCIQRAKNHECVVAQQRETGHWYWFKENDSLLPWSELRNEGAFVVDEPNYFRFHGARHEGPFATEDGAKRFGQNYVRRQIFDTEQKRRTDEKFLKAKESLMDLLKVSW